MIQTKPSRETRTLGSTFDHLVENPDAAIRFVAAMSPEKQGALLQRAAEPEEWKQLVQKFHSLPPDAKANIVHHGQMSGDMKTLFGALPASYQHRALALVQEYDSLQAATIETGLQHKGADNTETSTQQKGLDASFGSKNGTTTPATATTTTTPSPERVILNAAVAENDVAKQVLGTFNTAATMADKLKAMVDSVGEAQKSAATANTAVTAFATKLQAILTNITANELTPLWDGVWNVDDIPPLAGKVDLFLGLVRTFLTMTTDLALLAQLFDDVMTILKQIVEFAFSAAQLAGAAGEENINGIQNVSNTAIALMDEAEVEIKRITDAETDLAPLLTRWEAADVIEKGSIVTLHVLQLKSGFEKLGAAWSSVQNFFGNTVQPLNNEVTEVVAALFTSVSSYSLPSPGVPMPELPAIPWVSPNLFR